MFSINRRLRYSTERRRGKKLIDAAEWALNQASKCSVCKQTYAKREPPEDPPCWKCRVDPLESNADALNIFLTVRDQFIMSMGGPVGLDQNAIHKAMDLFEVKNKKECFFKVLALGHWWLGEIKQK